MPDFGLFRGFSDKLVAGQTPVNLGMIGSTSLFDADVLAFFNRVTNAGGTLSTLEQSAIVSLVAQMKADNTWSNMKAIYPMVGASSASCAQNLVSSSYTGAFTSGWTFSSSGVVSNGTSAYFNTNCRMSVDIPNFNSSWAYAGSAASWNGIFNGSAVFGFNNKNQIGIQCLTPVSPTAPSSFRLMSGSANSSGANGGVLYFDGTQHSTYTTNSMTTDIAFTLGSLNQSIYPTVNPSGFYNVVNIQVLTLGTALNSTQMSALYSALNTFNTTLSR